MSAGTLGPDLFSQLIELSPDAIAVHCDGKIIFANSGAARMIGAASALEMIGRDVTDFVPLDSRGSSLGENEAGKASYPLEDRLLRLDGSKVDVEIAHTPFTHQGRPATQIVLRDITSRKRAATALRDSQNTLAHAQRLTRTGSWELDLSNLADVNRNRLRWSDEVFRIFGYEPGTVEVSNESFFRAVHPEDRERVRAAVESAVNEGLPYNIDHRITLPNGAQRVVHEESHILRDEQDRPVKMVGIVQDITERKYVEEALRESQAKWRALAENAPDTIMTVDRDGTILFINRTLPQHRREHVMGATIFSLVSPEFRELTTASLRRVFETGESVSYEHSGDGANGQPAWYASRLAPINGNGGIVAAALISTDITKRKAAEADLLAWKNRYESVIRASGQIIYDWNPLRNTLTFGGCVEKMLGFKPEEMPATRDGWAELVHPEDREQFLQSSQAGGDAKKAFHLEYRIRGKTGEYVVVKDDGYLTVGASGKVLQMLGFVADISKQRTLETQLRHSQKMEAFGRLAGGVAHDFNNLLTVISGYNDIVLHDLGTNDPRREYVEEIAKAADRASSLTAQLLAFSRQQVLQPRILDLNSVLSDTGKMLRRLIGEDINLVIEPQNRVGNIKADLGQLENVLVNMAVNARDAMPDGGTLTIRTAETAVGPDHPEVARGLAQGSYVVLSVGDSGVGMSDAVKDRIFEPFFTTKAIGHGTGLGLATCYGIVTQSGGHIGVESKLGRGTTFSIYLPRVEDSADEVSARSQINDMPSGTETILVVEDEPAVRRLAVSILRGLGYNVLEAGNGEEAFMIMQTPAAQDLDLVITDIVMPEMGGKDLAYWIRSSLPKAKILFTSGYPDHSPDGDDSSLGEGTSFLPKPYAPKVFAQKIRDMLDAIPAMQAV